MYKGWIIAPLADKTDIQKLGIQVGTYNSSGGFFEDCIITDEKILTELDCHWGHWFWTFSKCCKVNSHGKKN